MTSLITGGTGLVGAELAHLLISRRERVILFDIAPNYQRINDIEDEVKVVQGHLNNWSDLCNVVKENKIRNIYHLGSMLGVVSEGNPLGALQTNVMGTYNVLEAARLFDVEKVMYSSSVATYLFELGEEVTDTTVQRPVSMYGVSKLCGEGMGRYFRNRFELDFRAIRFPGVVGPGVKTPGLWFGPMVENAILGNPYECFVSEETIGPLMFFKDAARAADMVLQAPKEQIKMLNYNVLASSEPASAKDLAEAVKRHIHDADITFKPTTDEKIRAYNKKLLKIFSEIKVWNDECARKEWGWKPAYPTVDDIVTGFMDEMKANPDRYINA